MEKFPANLSGGSDPFFSRSSLLEGSTSSSKDSSLTKSQKQVDGMVEGFVQQATDWRSLAAMMAGGMSYRLGRIGVMTTGGENVTRLLSIGVGLGTEVTAFEMTNRSLAQITGEGSQNPNLWRWNGTGGIRQGLLSSLITFGSLKGAGRLAQGENVVVQHLLQDTGMVLGHQISGTFGVTDRPTGTLAEQFLHAEATNLQLGAGMALAHQMAPGIQGMERGLDLSLRLADAPSGQDPLRIGPQPAFAMAAEGKTVPSDSALPDLLKNLNNMQMAGRKDGDSGSKKDLLATAPPSVKKLAKELRDRRKILPEELIEEVAHELLAKAFKDRWALTTEGRKFLLAVANRQLDEYRGSPSRYYMAREIFFTLYDFVGLRRLERILGDDNYHKWEALLKLEDYETLFPLIDGARKLENILHGMNWIFYGLESLITQFVKTFSEKRGIAQTNVYSFDATALALAELSRSYDLVIAIAKGGLFSGAMADFLGLDVRVIEVHAHNRKTPTSKFIDEIRPEDIEGKRILLVDKDTITGASIREAVRLIAPYGPSAIGVYFNYDVGPIIPEKAVQDLERLGIATHYASNLQPPPSLPLFYEVHERLQTPLGKFRKVMREFDDFIVSTGDAEAETVEVLCRYLNEQESLFFALNPMLPGVDRVRELMTVRLGTLLRTYRDIRVIDGQDALEHLKGMIKSDPPLPMGYGGELARARYHERGIAAARSRSVENIHVPTSYPAAFRSAQKALKDKYDVALIVGPEGFAYEPIFQDLRIPTLAVNIPEADFGGRRSIAVFDDLSRLKGKRVLVVEDDVQSGATLQKLLEEIIPYDPKYLGLYLGLPAIHQMRRNIPSYFRKIYVTEIDDTLDEEAFLHHLHKREVIFKDKKSPPP